MDAPPKVFFTLSLLIDGSQINDLIAETVPGRPGDIWNQRLLEKIEFKYMDSQGLQGDINPMFEDIADRSRNLFIKDFLLDTPNASGDHQSDDLRNVCATVRLELPGQVSWKAEGPPVTVDPGPPIAFDGVLCRAFWMAHSNHALSYHLSFEVPFEHGLRDYLGLSLLQKAFALSESTDWLIDEPDRGWLVRGAGAGSKRLLAFIEGLFEKHVLHLMGRVVEEAQVADLSATLPEAFAERAWQRLVLHSADALASEVTTAKQWTDAARSRRLLVLLSDATSFAALARANQEPTRLMALEPFAPVGRSLHSLTALEAQLAEHVTALNLREGRRKDAIPVEVYRLWLFLSGFLQNVVDFLDQDGLEIHDGLSPVYPSDDETDVNQGFMLYATPSVFYEVVSRSRSLDKAGRRWLGTCPYLFLVHVTAFHNERLVHAYEDNVSSLVHYLETKGLSSNADDTAGAGFDNILSHASDCIHDFRLLTFEQVHKHYAFNVFRYKTEQAFFETIEEVRGIVQRRSYWDDVLSSLTQTIDGLQEDRRARYEKKIASFGLWLALSGVLQVWFVLFPIVLDEESKPHGLSPMLHAALWGLVALGVLYKKWPTLLLKWHARRSKELSKAWRGKEKSPK